MIIKGDTKSQLDNMHKDSTERLSNIFKKESWVKKTIPIPMNCRAAKQISAVNNISVFSSDILHFSNTYHKIHL